MTLNEISAQILDASIKVHRTLGPGLLESTYEVCLAYELRQRGLRVETQVSLPVVYDGMRIDAGYRIDLLVEGRVIIELKVVEKILSLHVAQLITYLKLADKQLGIMINFNVTRLKDGFKRYANQLQEC